MRSTTPAPAGTLNVLFIGNSFTARNDLPGLLAQLAAAAGHRLTHRLISAGGASLRRHLNGGEALEAIGAGGYDHVVLQEQSTLPLKNAKRMHENVREFDRAIRAAGSRTMLYMTWPRRAAPPQAGRAIADAYAAIGEEIGAAVVPVGVVWERFLRGDDRPALYAADGSHPTLAGSYLAACVFSATLFGRSPAGLAVEAAGLAPEETAALRAAAEGLVTETRNTKHEIRNESKMAGKKKK